MYENKLILNTNNGDIMKKIPYLISILLFLIPLYKIMDIKIINNHLYQEIYLSKSNNIIHGQTPKRGRILDRNGEVLVDNQTIYNLVYRKINNININEEYEIAKEITKTFDLSDLATTDELKKFYIMNYDTNYLLTDEEKENYKFRKITNDDIYEKRYQRIDDELQVFNDDDKKNIHTFFLMNVGYNSDTKIIKQDVSFDLCATIEEKNLLGVSCDLSWKRVIKYPILENILGKVGKIPFETKDKFLNNGYISTDIVGISGLEEYYDNELKGVKSIYKVDSNNNIEKISDEIPGKDLVLSIDINIEQKIYDVLKEYLEKAEKFKNTQFYNHAYIIISNPNNGEILGLMGLQKDKINNEIIYKDISNKTMISSYTVGSLVKGASHTVGYLNNLIEVGKKINDSCVKLYSIPAKCSFKRLGYIDDISALKMSSNYYQFITAIKSTGNNYKNNMKLEVTEDNFNLYRDTFKKYGLGSTTGIDFSKESFGIKGEKVAPDLLLNLSIGQYDTYTPLQLTSYINTIATSGKRYKLSFKKDRKELIDEVNLDNEYMKRIQKGFYEVVNSGTGRGYTNKKYNAAGKTGTAQTFYNDKIISINQSYIMYAPYDNPKYSIVVVNPNISYEDGKNNYLAPINQMMSKSISDYLFENY